MAVGVTSSGGHLHTCAGRFVGEEGPSCRLKEKSPWRLLLVTPFELSSGKQNFGKRAPATLSWTAFQS